MDRFPDLEKEDALDCPPSPRRLWGLPRSLNAVLRLCAIVALVIFIWLYTLSGLLSLRWRPSLNGFPECHSAVDWFESPASTTTKNPNFRKHYKAVIRLPLDAPQLVFLADAPLASGTFHVVPDAPYGTTSAIVEVDAYYNDRAAFDALSLCRINKLGKHGLGIHTPTPWLGPDVDIDKPLDVSVRVRVPVPKSGAALKLNKLTTQMGSFGQYLNRLRDVHFDEIDIEGVNAFIQPDFLVANTISVKTTNRLLVGQFNVTRSLTLHNENERVSAVVHAFNDAEPGGDATKVSLRTTNSYLAGTLHLHSTVPAAAPGAWPSLGGNFHVDARANGEHLWLQFPALPPDARLKLDAANGNSPTDITLHPAFEGTFSLDASEAPDVRWGERVKDPKGLGRTRVANVSETDDGTTEGSVEWSPWTHGEGARRDAVLPVAPSGTRGELDVRDVYFYLEVAAIQSVGLQAPEWPVSKEINLNLANGAMYVRAHLKPENDPDVAGAPTTASFTAANGCAHRSPEYPVHIPAGASRVLAIPGAFVDRGSYNIGMQRY
ncbi:uncharacterized protein BXZ73DRAFT_100484 [Epithele typhae]|uniref:uncharacterized protein n=1 Tax=Epithele typhae TaxID=378194 RepID=UPI0020074C52|nr:uncharacterized protein BXZ73DRAFT_100484 [Epithele typhae]KAH9935092.1 hypothetical protein BXZ73DRAFT_100484 [Epithele typhae]